MQKWIRWGICLILIIGIVVFLIVDKEKVVLGKTSTVSFEDNFLLHIRTQETDDGVQVQNSIQYIGDPTVIVEHKNPLISVSYDGKHSFEGETVQRQMSNGSIYYQPKTDLDFPGDNEYIQIKVKCRVDGENIEFEYMEKIEFET
ncbi:hypothetical protein [Oceanobacillus sp. 1P07AA]|uniref:hypothetical protein n=1 Tax=Oceanobacillus sp. 1P07AA TaxID=3132293 RepID=UPI0039A53F8D